MPAGTAEEEAALVDPWASLVCSFLGFSAMHRGHSQEFAGFPWGSDRLWLMP